MGKIIYVTGAPATGKSSLCKSLAAARRDARVFCYSERLRDYVNQLHGLTVDEIGIRQASANIVRAEDVQAVDDLLSQEMERTHQGGDHLLIDSHPVTKEDYGFRVTAFSLERLRTIPLDVIVCLYADPAVLAQRIANDAGGRPMPTQFELALHVQLQVAVASQYAIALGQPCFVINSHCDRGELIERVESVSGLSQALGAS